MNKSMWKWCIVIGFTLGMNIPTWALLRNGGNYGEETKIGPDSQTGGWFINLGITGARGKMTPSAPTVIEVAYVLKIHLLMENSKPAIKSSGPTASRSPLHISLVMVWKNSAMKCQ